ncbi:MAG: spore germination protein [Pseudoflavonifractor sp.]
MGFFGREQEPVPPHRRQEPGIDLPLTAENMAAVFGDCADFAMREFDIAGDAQKRVTACYLGGMVKMERAGDYILRPLAQDETLRNLPLHQAFLRMAGGALYNLMAQERDDMDGAVADAIAGNLLLFFPGESKALSFSVGTEEKRSISAPQNEPAIKGARDAFVENLRTNTSLVRRHLRAPGLCIREQIVGRQSLTPVDILYLDGIANPETVAKVEAQVAKIDIDALLSTGNLEEFLLPAATRTAYPLALATERPDRVCTGLVEGRIGLLMEGLPLGYLVPADIGVFLRAPQDKSNNWMLASVLLVLRYLCLLVTLLLPAFYIAVVTFHPEMLPTRLFLSIIAARRDVPFGTIFEVLLLLVAFEILQEAGLRLPPSIGQTVSIIGGLVVGTAAVEAKLISPAVLIVVAGAGIAGYTMPSQELAGALRIWRFLLAVLAGLGGLWGMVLGIGVLVFHLAGLESFGVAYLTPFAASVGAQVEGHAVLRQPLPKVKLRDASLKTPNRRNQA